MTLRLLIFALVFAISRQAAAAGACDAATSAWVERCSARHGLELEVVACPPRALVVRDRASKLDIEIAPAGARSFRRAGAVGLSPVGDFPDWSKEPEGRRRVLDGLEACAAESAPPLAEQAGLGAESGALRSPAPPWFLLIASCLLVAVAWRRFPSGDAAIGIALFVATLAGRALLLPRAFLHQNGQGPAWISYALRDDVGLGAYGPGYPELFAAAARLAGAKPELGVFTAAALLGAVVPPAWFWMARRIGCARWPALGLATISVLDPVLARVAQSESYFGPIVALVSLAMLSLACAPPRVRSWRFAGAVSAAGLFAAEAARVHPEAWPVLLFVPLAALLGPGGGRRRARIAAFAGLGTLAMVALTSSGAIDRVASGSLGQHWAPRIALRPEALAPHVWLLLVPLGAALLLRTWRGFSAALAGVLVIAVALLSDQLGDPSRLVTAAHHRLYAPALALLVAAVVARARARGAMADRARARQATADRARARRAIVSGLGTAALVALGAFLCATRAPLVSSLPTDVLEAAILMRERERLEPGALVAYVERAGSRVAVLPLYDGITAGRVPIRVGEPLPRLGDVPKPAYYVRTSVCASPEARATCDDIEQSTRLELRFAADLPARPSMRWHAYDGERVPVRIFSVR